MREWKEKYGSMWHYDQLATIYDVHYVGEQNAKIENVLKSLKFSSNELVLDLGCGTGFLFPHIEKRLGFLVGLDVSRNALRQAKNRTKNRSNLELVCADADKTPFPNHIFDKIFAITILQNMPQPTKTIKEMKRTGKPQAIFALTGLKKKFTPDSFVDLLDSVQLRVLTLNNDQRLKGVVAVCTNR